MVCLHIILIVTICFCVVRSKCKSRRRPTARHLRTAATGQTVAHQCLSIMDARRRRDWWARRHIFGFLPWSQELLPAGACWLLFSAAQELAAMAACRLSAIASRSIIFRLWHAMMSDRRCAGAAGSLGPWKRSGGHAAALTSEEEDKWRPTV